MDFAAMFIKLITKNGLVAAFIIIGITTWIAYKIGGLTKGRIHGSAIAIFFGLILAYIGGVVGGGHKGLASIPMFAGVGVMGGAMFRDFAIVSTAFGADLREIKKVGLVGVLSLIFGLLTSWVAGVGVAYAMGYTDSVSLVTIGAGVATFVVGPVTGASLGASSEVIAISIAAGVVKSVLVMILTPFFAKFVGLDNPQSAMIYGGLMGTTSGTAAGMAAVDPKLVPYAAVTYILWGVTYTMMDIPYWSMIPAFTEGGKEREGLSTLARSCAGVGSAIVTIITMKCVYMLGQGNERVGFKWFALVVAILFFVFILITCLNIKEKSTVDVEAPSVGQMFRSLLQNDQAMTVVVTIVLINCSIYITSNLVIYFFKYDFGGDSWYNAYTLFNTFGGAMQILAMMLFFPILRKFLGTIQVFYTSFVMAIFRNIDKYIYLQIY